MNSASKLANELNSPAMLKTLGWLALGLALAVIGLRPIAFPEEPYLWGGDFSTFWAASWLAQTGDFTRLYGTEMMEGIPGLTASAPPWFYPPTMLLLVYPFASLPFLASYALFTALSLLLAVTIWKLWRLESLHLLLLLAAPATLLNVLYGQNGLLTAVLWIGGLLLLEKRPFIAGCLLGLLVIKPQLAVLAPFLLLAGRQWRALAGFAFSAALLFDLSWLAFGPQPWVDFVMTIAGVGTLMQAGAVLDVNKIGSMYMMARMDGTGHIEAILMQAVVLLCALTACLYLWWRRDVAFGAKAAAALITALMITPYQFIYDLPLLLGAIVFWHQANGNNWRGMERLCVWLLWLSPLLTQAYATVVGGGLLPVILILALWQLVVTSSATKRVA